MDWLLWIHNNRFAIAISNSAAGCEREKEGMREYIREKSEEEVLYLRSMR